MPKRRKSKKQSEPLAEGIFSELPTGCPQLDAAYKENGCQPSIVLLEKMSDAEIKDLQQYVKLQSKYQSTGLKARDYLTDHSHGAPTTSQNPAVIRYNRDGSIRKPAGRRKGVPGEKKPHLPKRRSTRSRKPPQSELMREEFVWNELVMKKAEFDPADIEVDESRPSTSATKSASTSVLETDDFVVKSIERTDELKILRQADKPTHYKKHYFYVGIRKHMRKPRHLRAAFVRQQMVKEEREEEERRRLEELNRPKVLVVNELPSLDKDGRPAEKKRRADDEQSGVHEMLKKSCKFVKFSDLDQLTPNHTHVVSNTAGVHIIPKPQPPPPAQPPMCYQSAATRSGYYQSPFHLIGAPEHNISQELRYGAPDAQPSQFYGQHRYAYPQEGNPSDGNFVFVNQ